MVSEHFRSISPLMLEVQRKNTRAYFNCITGGTNVLPVLAFVPPALVICPTIPDKIYGEHIVIYETITFTAVSDLISLSVDWTGIAQKTKLTVGVFSPCCLISHDCPYALSYPSLFQLMLKSLTDRHTVLLLDTVIYCQFLTVLNYNDLN